MSASSIGVFSEAAPGQFALTPMAALLRKDAPNSVRALAIMYSEEQYRAWGELLYSVRTGQPAFEHQFGMGVFEYFAQNPEPSAVFNEAMTGLTIQVADALAGGTASPGSIRSWTSAGTLEQCSQPFCGGTQPRGESYSIDLRWLLVQANILLSPVSRTAVRASVATSLRLCLPAETPTC